MEQDWIGQELIEQQKEILRGYLRAKRREKVILDEIQRLRADKMFPSIACDGMPHSSSHSDLSDYIILLDEQIKKLKLERLERVRQYQQVEDEIKRLSDNVEQEVLHRRYIVGETWSVIGQNMGYSPKQARRIHSKAIINLIKKRCP